DLAGLPSDAPKWTGRECGSNSYFTSYHHAKVCNGEPGPSSPNDLPQRVPSVSGPADHGPLHSPLVRRNARRLEHLPPFLSVRTSGGILVRALVGFVS